MNGTVITAFTVSMAMIGSLGGDPGEGPDGTLSLISISPIGGPPAGNTPVTLSGTGFQLGATVTIAGLSATSVVVLDSMTITARTPPHTAPFAADVTVILPDTRSSILTGGFTYRAAPTVTGVSPTSGTTAGGRVLAISGTNFVSGARIAFGGTDAPSVIVNSASSISATTPPQVQGQVDVVLINPDTQTATRPNAYTYTPLTLDNIDPAAGPTTGGLLATVNGQNFIAGTTVFFDISEGTDIAVVSDTVITARTPPHPPGPVNVVVRYSSGATDTVRNAFTYHLAPSLTNVSPNTGPVTGGTRVTVQGTNFVAGATLTVGGLPATDIAFVNANTLTATTPPHAGGAADVVERNPDGFNATLASGFTFGFAPTLTDISPASGASAGGTSVTLTGSNFAAGARVTFGGLPATAAVLDDRTILASAPPHVEGLVDINVSNPDSTSATLSAAFAYHLPPVLTGISPSVGPTSGGTGVTLTGLRLFSGATVVFGGALATSVTYVDATTVTAVSPPHSSGQVSVVVRNPDEQSASLQDRFTYQGTDAPIGAGPPPLDSSTGCAAGASLPSLLALAGLLLWLQRRHRQRDLPQGVADLPSRGLE